MAALSGFRTLATVAALVFSFASATVPALAAPRPGEAAPPFSLKTIDGTPVSPASLKGKPVYLNFFATWCGPCRLETPSIVGLSNKYRGIRIVGIDVGENSSRTAAFAREFKIPYPLVSDSDSTMRSSYGAGLFFPLHVFIDARGIVRTYVPGEMNPNQIEAALKSISKQ